MRIIDVQMRLRSSPIFPSIKRRVHVKEAMCIAERERGRERERERERERQRERERDREREK